jgi:hypothetical protein
MASVIEFDIDLPWFPQPRQANDGKCKFINEEFNDSQTGAKHRCNYICPDGSERALLSFTGKQACPPAIDYP